MLAKTEPISANTIFGKKYEKEGEKKEENVTEEEEKTKDKGEIKVKGVK